MNLTKEEPINGVGEKEAVHVTPKISKRPIERPLERKPCITTNTSTEVTRFKPIYPDVDSVPEIKVPKPKITNGNYSLKVDNSGLSSAENKNIRVVKNIGFENLANQVYRRALFTGFEFNLMVVGCSGLGKSTFVNSLFLTELYNGENTPPSKRIQKTTSINETTVLLKENDVNLKLTLVDTPGFGDAVDNTDCWKPVVEYVEQKYNEYMLAQNHLNRSKIQDGRVHACLYFIQPTGHGLKPLDIEFLRRLHNKVNVIPVIGKADSLVPEECADFKKTILGQIKAAGIKTYDFSEEAAVISLGVATQKHREGNLKEILMKRRRQPFAIATSNVVFDKAGSKVRGRQYPWGLVEVDSLDHNDFPALRTLLLSSHLQDLRDHTDQHLYEHFRCGRLSNIAQQSQFSVSADGKDPMSRMDEERRDFEKRIASMEVEMETMFAEKVRAKTKRMEETREQLERSRAEMERQLEQELRELDFRRQEFEADRLQWEERSREGSLRASMDQLDAVGGKTKARSKWLLK